MWTTILTALIPFLVKLLSIIFDRVAEKKQQRKEFNKFLEQYYKLESESLKQQKSVDDQIKDLQNKP